MSWLSVWTSNARRPARPRLFQSPDQGFVFSDVVGGLPDAFADLGNRFAVCIRQQDADARRAGVAFGSAVNK